MKFNNKRGIIEDALAAIVVILIAAIMTFFIFYINSNNNEIKKNYEIQKQKDIVEGQKLLMEYLTSIDKDGNSRSGSISSLIEKGDYNTVKSDMKTYFDPKLAHLSGWKIIILDNEGGVKSIIDGGKYERSSETYKVASIFVPLKYEGYIILRLNYGRGIGTNYREALIK